MYVDVAVDQDLLMGIQIKNQAAPQNNIFTNLDENNKFIILFIFKPLRVLNTFFDDVEQIFKFF